MAEKLLLETEHSLAEIALECGFVDQSHFSKAFVRRIGVTPGRYRRHLQNLPFEKEA